ncbi:MAG: GNAT family N-acetyltransferase [Dorea sp.]|nr:GNAT family N-acetyltransferase [Dorea sp.]
MENIIIRKAETRDIDGVSAIYENIHTEVEAGRIINGWIRGLYPTRDTVTAGVERGDFFVLEADGEVVASCILNHVQDEAYQDADWIYDAREDEVLVMHTLVVEPAKSGKGYAKSFLTFYEEYARELGCKVLRLDTLAMNKIAKGLYTGRGYRIAGYVTSNFYTIGLVGMICFEKKLDYTA